MRWVGRWHAFIIILEQMDVCKGTGQGPSHTTSRGGGGEWVA
jgi:hypothetical protein